MKDAFAPLKHSEVIKDIFVTFADNPLLGVFVGVVFTVLLQSSSATIAIVQVLAFNGVISFDAALIYLREIFLLRNPMNCLFLFIMLMI